MCATRSGGSSNRGCSAAGAAGATSAIPPLATATSTRTGIRRMRAGSDAVDDRRIGAPIVVVVNPRDRLPHRLDDPDRRAVHEHVAEDAEVLHSVQMHRSLRLVAAAAPDGPDRRSAQLEVRTEGALVRAAPVD